MTPPSPKLAELARRIVEQGAGGSPDPGASAASVDAACRRLRDHLVDLLGSGGVSALLNRALHLAQREQAVLAGLALSEQSDACFTGLTAALEGTTDEEAWEAAATILTHTVNLLIMLLGEELGMKPIRKLWPQATSATEIDE